MHPTSPSMRRLARRLLHLSRSDSDPPGHETTRVIEKLRVSLTRFAGAEGFSSLLRRTLSLASVEMQSLRGVTIDSDGRLHGVDQIIAQSGTSTEHTGNEFGVTLVAHLLELLASFIGERMCLRLVQQAWPDDSLDENEQGNEVDS